jgi:hypothetical protein
VFVSLGESESPRRALLRIAEKHAS